MINRSHQRIILAIIICLVFAVGGYAWADEMMDSIYVYRSPLHDRPPPAGQPLGEPITRRVVFVLIDGLREDTSLDASVMPFLNELRQQGAWATMHSRPPSLSQPGYTVLLTGAWPELSDGPTINLDYADIPSWTQDNLFAAINRAGMKAAVSGYHWYEKLIPPPMIAASFYTPASDRTADRQVVDAALPWLMEGGYQFVLIHLDQVDHAGHDEGGPLDPRWNAAAGRADSLLREIAVTLDLTQDTLFVGSDHGHIDRGGHGGQDRDAVVEPFVLVGAGVRPGDYGDVNMVDVGPTLAALLGTNIPASSQGQVLTDMLELTQNQLTGVRNALKDQQSQLVDFYQAAIGWQVAVEPGEDIVASHQFALQAARETRRRSERIPRALSALVLVSLPATLVLRKKPRDFTWVFVGAVLYPLVFNFLYAVLDGRTYSLSSLKSAIDLISFFTTTAIVALLLSWLVVMLRLKAFRHGPRRVSELTLGLTLGVIYLLLLPVLWSFALNGATITWVLPEMGSTFLAFISLLQITLVSVFGLLLTGISAIVAGFVTRVYR